LGPWKLRINRLAIVQRLIAISHDRGEMDETSSAALALDEAEALAGMNHFTVPCSLLTALLFSVSRVTAEHYIELSDAPSSEPSTEPGRLKLRSGRPQSGPANKKMAASVTLRPLLLPKGDTRATNAKTEYHDLGDHARGFWAVVECKRADGG